MQELLDSVESLSTKERKALAALLGKQGVNLYAIAPIFKRDATQPLRLSYAQQRQWFLAQLDGEAAAYTITAALRFTGMLDVSALQRSFEALIRRHETLRTTFVLQDEQPVQVIHPEQPFSLTLTPLPNADEAAVRAQVEAQAALPFDLQHGPLLRVNLLQLAEQTHVLVLTLHHIIADGWSMPIMVEELVRLYAGFSQGQAPELASLPIQYADYALWQRDWMEAGEQARQLEYWQAQLGEQQPVLELPTDRPRPPVRDHAGARIALPLPAELVQGIRQLAQQHGATPFMLLLASFQALLHRYSGQHDIRVGVPIANRNRSETQGLIGFFVNTQVLRAEVDPALSFVDLLRQVRQRAVDAQSHQDLPFEQLVEALQPERSLGVSPLFQVLYNHQREGEHKACQLPGLAVEPLVWDSQVAKFDLSLDTVESVEGISASLTYATDLFDHSTLERMGQHWLNLLQDAAQHPHKAVADLELLDAAERQQVLHAWNATDADYPASACVHQLFETQAAATPDAHALLFGEATMTYAELNQRANALAHKLRELGVGPDVLVAIAMERGLEMVVGLLAILKAGGAYVPLDPDYPQARLEYMLEDSAARVVLSQASLLQRLPAAVHPRTLLLDSLDLSAYPTANPTCHSTSENLAYSIYTSGSTGLPKGVLIEHRSVCALIGWTLSTYSREQLSGVLASTSICFDLSVWELFATLAAGGYAVIARNALELPSLPARDKVRLVNTVPSAIQALVESGGLPATVRTVNLCGEALKQSLVEALYQTGHVEQVYDLYGPSEDTVYSTLALREAGGTATIGRPLSNSAAFILGSAGQVMPVGAAGELYLAGAGLARGYLNRPSLTAERFVPNPFNEAGGRIYRTGDLTRYQADGQIQFAGRLDHQVKIRGFRIELGEIDARLQAHPRIRQVALLAVEGAGGQQLVAYLVPTDLCIVGHAEGEAALRDELRTALRIHLPDYMIPAHLLLLEQLPLTPNGKLDRKALPAPDAQPSHTAYRAPQSALEQQVAATWGEVLKLEQIGLDDNFFERGGHSLLATQVVARLQIALGVNVPLALLFQTTTLQDFAAALGNLDTRTDADLDDLQDFMTELEAV